MSFVFFDTSALVKRYYREVGTDEVENYEGLILDNSGMEPDRVAQFVDLLFQYVEVVPAEDFHPAIERADEAIGDTTAETLHDS